jgi:hypothetical protein
MAVAVLLFQAGCATSASRGTATPTHYAQSMNSAVDGCLRNPACAVSTPGDEAVIPWVSRAVDATRTAVTLKEFLDAAELRRVEELLVECAREADFQVNEREFGPGKYPSDTECDRVVGHKDGEDVTRAMELGTMKHAVAFACVRSRLLSLFPDNISVEPRYGRSSSAGQYALTDRGTGSLRPDIVLHLAGNPNKVQCVYDFKFPCKADSKLAPIGPKVRQQLESYDNLGGTCPPAVVTPQLGVNHE